MRSLPIAICLLLLGCGSDGPQPQPSPTPLAAPVWEAPVQVGDAGPGYPVGTRGYQSGGPLQLAVDAAGNAFLASARAALVDPRNPSVPHVEAWGNAYRVGSGWDSPARLSEGTGLGDDWPSGLGLTPDGALFGWRAAVYHVGPVGLRGFGVRDGWLPPGTLLDIGGSGRVASMVTDSNGVPAVVYFDGSRSWLVRHTGVLQGPEEIWEGGAGALAADGSGALAVAGSPGGLAVRLPDGRWVRTSLPAAPGSSPSYVALSGRPGGGFVAGWIEQVSTTLTYAAADVDAGGNPGPRSSLGSVPAPQINPTFGPAYDPQPRLVASAGPRAAMAWRTGAELYVGRQGASSWGPVQAVPGAAVAGGSARMGARLPFDLALDGSGTLLLAWTSENCLVSVQRGPDQSWSPTSLVTTAANDVIVAMNAAGTAFAAWREGQAVMAARSPRR